MTHREAHDLATAAERLAARLRGLDGAGAVASPRVLADLWLARVELMAAAAEAAAELRA